ncbi:diguanylate cyclase [Sphaerospermopsis aphanizomenoides BCCUSP55]|uniref:diguanylate cyclase domain-containing protein n=1 Tax=Sphaerospermopsis aphanizomenoides TaxID=459663 RepID=UPI001903DAEA|nr:diguanylate cyclase [Sphaerospermopsis aphanizomenoides]MBK1987860.1 diguanylate cyclase [Sphaerospermopsis aphanizomenoides BCCUSP55]
MPIIKLKNWLFPTFFRPIIINLIIIIAYSIGVKLSVEFASLPGQVSSVWFPSSLTLASIFLFGNQILPGIIIGSVIGLYEILLELQPPLSILNIIFLHLICASGNCLQPFTAKYLFNKFSPYPTIFNHVSTVYIFIIVAIFSPTISATFGITASSLIGTIPWSSYGVCWLHWWLASALAHLTFTPTLLLIPNFNWRNYRYQLIEIFLTIGLMLVIAWLSFIKAWHLEYLLLPILIATVLRLGKFFSSLLVSMVSLFAIFATAKGQGIFIQNSPHESLIILQSFTSVFSLTSLVLSAVIDERKAAQLSLQQTLANLESQVREQTQALRKSEAQLDAFFSSASIGMCIIDQELKYVRVNEILAEINGKSVSEHLGKRIKEILPLLGSEVENHCRQVITTGKPLLNQEISISIHYPLGIYRTWLASYFPIFDTHNIPFRLGIVVMEISDRKQLELQLQQQLRLDGLTQIANRRCFDEVLLREWQRCTRNQQPLSLILCDADYFKAYNDTYGHPSGDNCLIKIANVLSNNVQRASDLVARYGGEEFAILLSDTTAEGAIHVANSIRKQIHHLKIPHEKSLVADHVTLSIGVASCIPSLEIQPEKLVNTADQALYEAKHQGRDRIILKI